MLLGIASIFGVAAQTAVMEVNGLILGNKYTDAQMKAALGEPTRAYSWNDEFGGGREYQYGPENEFDMFRYQTEWGFNSFSLSTSAFALFNGQLKVGDNLSKVSLLGFGTLTPKGTAMYYFYLPNWDDPLIIHVNSGNIITSMQFAMGV